MKWIKITPEQQQLMLKKFQDLLTAGRFSDGKINFSESIDKVTGVEVKKPTIYFTAVAWLKMLKLIDHATTEIGWHGVVDRNAEKGAYLIKDILVYPQTVTGATVTTDELEYGQWLMKQPDGVFEKIRFQGHSHVNFGVTPSGVDENFYNNILQTLTEGDYYIFMIMNKRGEVTIMLYDFTQNIIFEKADITLKVTDGKHSIDDWVTKMVKDNVKTYSYTPPAAAIATRYAGAFSGVASEYSGSHLTNPEYDDDDWFERYNRRMEAREALLSAPSPDTGKGKKNKKDKKDKDPLKGVRV
jgi:hypothetical protein